MVEGDASGNGRQGNGIFPVRDLGRGIQNLEDSFCCRNVGDQLVIEVAQVHDGPPEHIDIASEGKQSSYRHLIHADDHNTGIIKRHAANAPAKVDNGAEGVI